MATQNPPQPYYIRGLVKHPALKTTFHWVKAHAGTEGNEKADKLAKQGRSLAAANGGRDYTAPPLIPEDAETGSFAQLEKALHNAAVDTFKVHPFRKRTPWIRDETLTALTAARTAEVDHSPDAKTLRNKAKRMARKDRTHWVHQQLQSDPSGEHGVIWKTIKNQKKGFVGKKSHLTSRWKTGTMVANSLSISRPLAKQTMEQTQPFRRRA